MGRKTVGGQQANRLLMGTKEGAFEGFLKSVKERKSTIFLWLTKQSPASRHGTSYVMMEFEAGPQRGGFPKGVAKADDQQPQRNCTDALDGEKGPVFVVADSEQRSCHPFSLPKPS